MHYFQIFFKSTVITSWGKGEKFLLITLVLSSQTSKNIWWGYHFLIFFFVRFFFLVQKKTSLIFTKIFVKLISRKNFFNAIDDLWRGYVMRSKSPWAKKSVFFQPHQFGFLNHPYLLFQHVLFSNWDFLFQPPVELVGIQTERNIVNFNI